MSEELPGLARPKEVQKVLGCSLPWVYKAAEAGILPCVRIPCIGGGRKAKTLVRFKWDDIRSFMESNYSGRTSSY